MEDGSRGGRRRGDDWRHVFMSGLDHRSAEPYVRAGHALAKDILSTFVASVQCNLLDEKFPALDFSVFLPV